MSREQRQELIKAIEQERKSKVVCYVTSDRQNLNHAINHDIIPVLHKHLRHLEVKETDNVDLLIYSRGGNSDVPWMIASAIREYCTKGTFNVLIPYKAHSAATMLAIGADTIIMTPQAELGPIDVTLTTAYNPKTKDTGQPLPISVEDVLAYFSLIDKVTETNTEGVKPLAFQLLSQNVHPIALGTVNRVLEQTELATKRLLQSRSSPLSEEKNTRIAQSLASKIYSHNHAIHRREAVNDLEIEFVEDSGKHNIDGEMWRLYELYSTFYEFDIVFDPESYLILENVEFHKWEMLPLCSIESREILDVKYVDVIARRLRQIPPQIHISLSDMQLPPIAIGNELHNVPAEQLQALIQQIISQVLNKAVDESVIKATKVTLDALPSAGVERVDFNHRWVEGE